MLASFEETASPSSHRIAEREAWEVPQGSPRSLLRPEAIVDNSAKAH